jgi:hypothetical protein
MTVRHDLGRSLLASAGVALAIALAACAPSLPTTQPETGGPTATSAAVASQPMTPATPSVPEPTAASTPTPAAATPSPTPPPCPPEIDHFPVGYTEYHTYAGLCETLAAAAKAHPDIVRLLSIGHSTEGRTIWAMEIGTHLSDGTHPPGVLFDGLHHGLEHLSLEMPIAILGWLLDGYGRDPAITSLVQTRAVFIVFDVNPDGAAFDITGGRFMEWRKNRQPEPGGAIGTDLNRNYADHWACCGLVSSNPASPYFAGSAPFSAPEAGAIRDFVLSRVFDGRQQIRAAITFHASGRLVMWPYGYTRTAIPSDMSADDHGVFVAMGTAMARLSGYLPEQASGLYVDSGTARDWYYGTQGIFAFTFELGTGTYQPSAAIATETARNRDAVLYLMGMADCPYRAIGKESAHCG